jgi:hypothetical protein
MRVAKDQYLLQPLAAHGANYNVVVIAKGSGTFQPGD